MILQLHVREQRCPCAAIHAQLSRRVFSTRCPAIRSRGCPAIRSRGAPPSPRPATPSACSTAAATYSLLLRLESLQQRQLEELTVLSTSGKDGVAGRGKEYPDIMGKVIPEQQSRFECVSCVDPAANDQPTSQALPHESLSLLPERSQ